MISFSILGKVKNYINISMEKQNQVREFSNVETTRRRTEYHPSNPFSATYYNSFATLRINTKSE